LQEKLEPTLVELSITTDGSCPIQTKFKIKFKSFESQVAEKLFDG
jgi:hypothetical protein